MITIYGHERCSWCKKAKALVEQYSLKYQYLNTDDAEVLKLLKESLPDVKTVPQIWWGDRHIGGYDMLVNEIQNTIGGYGEQKF
jgi:glutaredoxin 3